MKHDVAQLKSGFPSVALRVAIDPAIDDLQVSRSAAAKLTTRYNREVEHVLGHSRLSTQKLTPPAENAFLSESAKAALDARGLIRPGTVLEDGAIIASIIRAKHVPDAQGAQQAPEPEKPYDDSYKADADWSGYTVKSIDLASKNAKITIPNRIVMELEYVHELSIADILLLGSIASPVCGFFDSDEVDVKVAPQIGASLGLMGIENKQFDVFVASPDVRHSIVGRGTGPYSFITNAPLFGWGRNLAPRITPPHIHTMRECSLGANLAELLTLKYTDCGNRKAVVFALVGNASFPKPGAPYAVHVLRSHLAALGLRASFDSSGDHLVLSVNPLTDPERLALSSGLITKPETINYRDYKPVPCGIFCQDIFGHEYETPDCEEANLRGRERSFRFGHIDLAFPVIAPHWRLPAADGSPSALATYLGISDRQLDQIMSFAEYVEIEDDQVFFVPRHQDASATSFGANSIALLNQHARQQNPDLPDLAPFLVQERILVLPPDLRPIVLLENGNFATSDLNDHYRRVINRNNRLRKLLELKAPHTIIQNEFRMLQQTVDALIDNENCPRPVLGSQNRPLRSLWGFARTMLQGDVAVRCDYSARAHAIPDGSLDPHTVAVPDSIVSRLGIRRGDPLLCTRQSADESAAPIMFLSAASNAHCYARLPAGAYRHLFGDHQIAPVLHLHRPLGPDARSEALARLGENLLATMPPASDWLDAAPTDLTLTMISAALCGERLNFSSPRGVGILGPGIPELTPMVRC